MIAAAPDRSGAAPPWPACPSISRRLRHEAAHRGPLAVDDLERSLALRAVTSTDGMAADSYPFVHDVLARVASRIVNEVRGINRVTYDITSKPPGTIEWE